MINFSTSMRPNPRKPDEPRKAYANAQYSGIMTLSRFAGHIATHGSKYNRADIQAVLIQAVDCMREMLLAGQRIEMGELGVFYVSLKCTPTDKLEDFSSANIKDVNVRWSPGPEFKTLIADAEFNYVPTRAAALLVTRALKKGETNVDLSELGNSGSGGGTDTENPGGGEEGPMG